MSYYIFYMSYYIKWPPWSLDIDFSFGPKKMLVYMGSKKYFIIVFDDKISNHVASANNIMLDIL